MNERKMNASISPRSRLPATECRWRMFRKSGYRFSDKNMRQRKRSRAYSDPFDRNMLWRLTLAKEPPGFARRLVRSAAASDDGIEHDPEKWTPVFGKGLSARMRG